MGTDIILYNNENNVVDDLVPVEKGEVVEWEQPQSFEFKIVSRPKNFRKGIFIDVFV